MNLESIKAAVQEFEDEAFHHSMHPVISDTAKTIALAALREAETRRAGCADVAGEWIADGANGFTFGFNCSVCKGYETYRAKFCKDCGARMDGGDT